MRVGARIIEVCETLEELGPSGVGFILPHMAPKKDGDKLGGDSLQKFVKRALEMKLVTVEESPISNRGHYNVYTVQPDWRERIKGTIKAPPAPKPVRRAGRKSVFSFASSIFSIGV